MPSVKHSQPAFEFPCFLDRLLLLRTASQRDCGPRLNLMGSESFRFQIRYCPFPFIFCHSSVRPLTFSLLHLLQVSVFTLPANQYDATGSYLFSYAEVESFMNSSSTSIVSEFLYNSAKTSFYQYFKYVDSFTTLM